ncbi:Arabinose 5-phosphate isomerase KdsD [Corynebacterium ciconiae DSM 44920]|uniref:DUF294 nucleotidyltransferase-like domain-containing protein n=1 Tax=Corynebacterium ciconiae TaxID=227319 RepID=UPI0003617086|nr:DUF294 nucleotidyltransferase-like domain-containing protein [Corynebacterium ciconiae]WKD61048.1 Arabinose 5-phosphate isomerase KdsD [Corynebacterium ciconiae DSM 44920]
MNVELEEVRDFLAEHEPFKHLPADALGDLPQHMVVEYVRAGEVIFSVGQHNRYLNIIRSGAVDVLGEDGVLLDRRDAGRSFGYSTLEDDSPSLYTMTAVEDSLVLRLPREAFLTLCTQQPQIYRFFSSQSQRMRARATQLREESSSDALRSLVGECMVRTPACCGPDTPIREAAARMAARGVSSLLVVDGDETVLRQGMLVDAAQDSVRLRGIVTDKDMTKKVVAEALDSCLPISEVMTPDPVTVSSSMRGFEAMLLLAQHRIHHLPVIDDHHLVGIVASGDIMRLLRNDPIFVHADMVRAETDSELTHVYSSAKEVAARFIERGADPAEVSGLLTLAADALAQRVIALTEEEMGPPPVPYCFVVLGSHGRREMGFGSDQDNALILDDTFNPAEHKDYFAEFSHRVCTRLDAAGQVLCPGEMMASNPEWRMTVSQWTRTFHTWVSAPEPDAVLHTQVFFDMRGIAGSLDLAEEVIASAHQQAHSARRLHAHLAALAARRDTPLGFFRGLVVERGGDYANTLDVKKGGTATIVQMARLFALSAPADTTSRPLGTSERLEFAMASNGISAKGGADLLDSLHFLTTVVHRHQAAQLRAGASDAEVDYHIDPKQLSTIEREGLRDAFSIIRSMQSALSTKYPVRSI